jgi:purine-nucleoside phosphorylase
MHDAGDTVAETCTYLRARGIEAPRIGMILGTGFGAFADTVEQAAVMPYAAIPHFPVSTVADHAGNLVYGRRGRQTVLVMQGRFHRYEGYTDAQIAFPIRVMDRLGVSILILTNASGGLNPFFKAGDLMLVEDHLHFNGGRPPEEAPGCPRRCYDPALMQHVEDIAHRLGAGVRRGVLAWMSGPSLETRAEIAMLRQLGADAVTMSTIPEAMAARRLHLRTLGISCISNLCVGVADASVDPADVVAVVSAAVARFTPLMHALLDTLSEAA